MLLDAIGKDAQGGAVRNRIRFFDIARDRFSWESRTSRDDGKTWTRAASLPAARVVR